MLPELQKSKFDHTRKSAEAIHDKVKKLKALVSGQSKCRTGFSD